MSGCAKWVEIKREDADEGPYQVQQVEFQKKVSNSVAWYPYGYNALAPLTTPAAMIQQQGDSRFHMCASPATRPLVATGENVVFHPVTLSKLHFLNSGNVEITLPSGSLLCNVAVGDTEISAPLGDITLTAQNINLNGSVSVGVSAPASTVTTPTFGLTATTSVVMTSPSTTIGDGVNDVVELMAELAEFIRDAQVQHSGVKSMTAATQAAADVLAAKIRTLA